MTFQALLVLDAYSGVEVGRRRVAGGGRGRNGAWSAYIVLLVPIRAKKRQKKGYTNLQKIEKVEWRIGWRVADGHIKSHMWPVLTLVLISHGADLSERTGTTFFSHLNCLSLH